MGLLGTQLLVTIIVSSFVHKLSPYYSFGRWFIARKLKRFLPPSDDCLRPYIIKTGGPSAKNHGSNDAERHLFIKKTAKINLTAAPLNEADLTLGAVYYPELKWILDLLLAVVFVLLATLVYYAVDPSARTREVNICLVWIIVLLVYVIKSMVSLTRVFLSEQLYQERWTCILMTAILLVCALLVLLMDEELLEFGLEESHLNLLNSLKKWRDDEHLYLRLAHMVPVWMLKFVLALVSSCLGTLLTFPSMNFSRMQFDMSRDRNLSVILKTLLRACYFLPVFCATLWIKPAARNVFTTTYQFTNESFDLLRVGLLLTYCVLRFSLYTTYLQSYLNRAQACVSIVSDTKITVSQLRTKIAGLFTSFGCVALQYLGPVILLLLCSLLLFFSSECCHLFTNTNDDGGSVKPLVRVPLIDLTLYRGVFSFLCWWICFSMFITSSIGSILHQSLF